MKKILLLMGMSVSLLFSAINLQTASKKELMCIKGIGEKKAEALLKYRKKHTLESPEDLMNIKGFGKGIIRNVKQEIQSVACSGKKGSKNKKGNTKSQVKKKQNQKKHEKRGKKWGEHSKGKNKSEKKQGVKDVSNQAKSNKNKKENGNKQVEQE